MLSKKTVNAKEKDSGRENKLFGKCTLCNRIARIRYDLNGIY